MKDKYPRVTSDSDSPSKKNTHGQRFSEYARLNTPRSQIRMEIENVKDLRWPNSLRDDPSMLGKSKYC